MPQMAPISWLTLFLIFTFLYILFTIINYFTTVPMPPYSKDTSSDSSTSPFNWKW
uniref:ATP synthase complex subunit 8 n=1 Tax=Caenis sp. JYZ-2020 TaxID=2717116 RepID=A0A6G7SD83_9INSE|nr:ATP synthase F0 subunit 8 [Caenis sp. JYZ-2020]